MRESDGPVSDVGPETTAQPWLSAPWLPNLGDGWFLRDLCRMVVQSTSWSFDERTFEQGDKVQGLWILQDRIEGAGLLRVRHDLSFSEERAAIKRILTIDIDTDRLDGGHGIGTDDAESHSAERQRVLLAAYPGNWSSPVLRDGSGATLSSCVRAELLPDLAAAAIELLSLVVPLAAESPDRQLLQECAAKVIDRTAMRFEESRGLASIDTLQAFEAHRRHSRDSTGRCIAWVAQVAARFPTMSGPEIGGVLADVRHVAFVAVPRNALTGRHRLTLDFEPVPLTTWQADPGRPRTALRRQIDHLHLTRDIDIPLPDMAPALEANVRVTAPTGLEFSPSLLVRSSRRINAPTASSVSTRELPPELLSVERASIGRRIRDVAGWVDQVLDRDVPMVLELPLDDGGRALEPLPSDCMGPLKDLLEFRDSVAEVREELQAVPQGCDGESRRLSELDDRVSALLQEARRLGFRATFFPDLAPEPEVFVARLPRRTPTDRALQLELRFHARLRPSHRTYAWSVAALVASTVLTTAVALSLILDLVTRPDGIVTILVLVPAALLGAVLSTTRAGMSRQVLRHWLNLLVCFGVVVPVTLAVLVATVEEVPDWVSRAVLVIEAIGLVLTARASWVRSIHKGNLPRTRFSALVAWGVLRLPNPLEVVAHALRAFARRG